MRTLADWLVAGWLVLALGCAASRKITITTQPPGAALTVDGRDRGISPLTETFEFPEANTVHQVTAYRRGYNPATVQIRRNTPEGRLLVMLPPRTRRVTFHVSPVPGLVYVDDHLLSDEPVREISAALEFTWDPARGWSSHYVTARSVGYSGAEISVRWEDQSPDYTLNLDTARKDLRITTDPDGALVYLNGELLGKSPVSYAKFPFPTRNGLWAPQHVKVAKPGYLPAERDISWDNGRTDYHITLEASVKRVRIVTDPPDADVRVEGGKVTRDAGGAAVIELPGAADRKADAPAFNVTVSKPAADDAWEPQTLTLRPEDARDEYRVALRPAGTRRVELLRAEPAYDGDDWKMTPVRETTAATVAVDEPGSVQPVRIVSAPKGSTIDTLAISPDGDWLLFTELTTASDGALRSHTQMIHTDGSGSPVVLDDGKALILTPSFTPDGSSILFASNRHGSSFNIWRMKTTGEGMKQLTENDSIVLWPTVDADPKPRLFYEAFQKGNPTPQLWMLQPASGARRELTSTGGSQPRIGPKGDVLLFTSPGEGGKRDLFRVSTEEHPDPPVNLTNTPDADESDPAWSPDGSRIAFTRVAAEQGAAHPNVWLMDLAHPEEPTRITANASHDDRPVFDPTGQFLYFRSNRGGTWGIWKIAVK